MQERGTCRTCGKQRSGNWTVALPDGSCTRCTSICLDSRCEQGLNTFWTPEEVSA